MAIDSLLTSRLFPAEGNSSELLYFVHGTSALQVQAYGEHISARCTTEGALFGSFFFRRRFFSLFPAEFNRLVPTLAYQICVAPSCPRELKIEILGALYMEPNIPEQTLYNQFQKLLISPLQKFPGSQTSSIPIIFVLDSIHTCEDVKHLITPIARVVNELAAAGINMRFVVTSVSYRYVLNALQKQDIAPLTYDYPIIPLNSYVQQISFLVRNWMYELPDLVQSVVVGLSIWASVVVFFGFGPIFLGWSLAAVGLPPAVVILAVGLGYGAVFLSMVILLVYWPLALQLRVYQEMSRLLQSRV